MRDGRWVTSSSKRAQDDDFEDDDAGDVAGAGDRTKAVWRGDEPPSWRHTTAHKLYAASSEAPAAGWDANARRRCSVVPTMRMTSAISSFDAASSPHASETMYTRGVSFKECERLSCAPLQPQGGSPTRACGHNSAKQASKESAPPRAAARRAHTSTVRSACSTSHHDAPPHTLHVACSLTVAQQSAAKRPRACEGKDQ